MGVSRAWLYASAPACFAIGLVYVFAGATLSPARLDAGPTR